MPLSEFHMGWMDEHADNQPRIPADLSWKEATWDAFNSMVENMRSQHKLPDDHRLYIHVSGWILDRLAEDQEEVDRWCSDNNVTLEID